MLTLTNSAVTAIRELISEPDTDHAGLRIATTSAQDGTSHFSAEITPEPTSDDQVVEEQGARVFLDPMAAVALQDKALDAEITEQGQLQLQLKQQSP